MAGEKIQNTKMRDATMQDAKLVYAADGLLHLMIAEAAYIQSSGMRSLCIDMLDVTFYGDEAITEHHFIHLAENCHKTNWRG